MALKSSDRRVSDAIDSACADLVASGREPSADFADELLQVMNDAVDEFNASAPKGRKTQNIKSLGASHVAQALCAIYHVRLVSSSSELLDPQNAQLAVYESTGPKAGLYNPSEDDILAKASVLVNIPTEKYAKDLLFLMRLYAPVVTMTVDRDLIAVDNGVFDYKAKELLPFSPDYVFMAKSRVPYDPNAQNVIIDNPDDGTTWDVESWISEISIDAEIEQLLWEITSAIIRPNVAWDKAAWFFATKGANGKGTFCELLRSLCGQGTYCSIPVADFGKPFALEPLLTASAIIVDENDNGSYLDTAGDLKAVITNDVVNVNRKHKKAITHRFRGFMVQCFNEYPKFKDRSGSLYRRQLIVPFDTTFTGRERKYIKYDYVHRPEVLAYVLKRALESNFYQLSTPSTCIEALDGFILQNDPITEFFQDVFTRISWDIMPPKIAYAIYKEWLKENLPGGKPVGFQKFRALLIEQVEASDDWLWTGSRYRTDRYITVPEPLLEEFHVDAYLDHKVRASHASPNARCMPPNLKDRYEAPIKKAALDAAGGDDDDD